MAFYERHLRHTIILYGWVRRKNILAEIGKQFEEEEGIKANVVSEAYDNTHNKITTSVMGGSPVDMAYLDTIWPAESMERIFFPKKS